jgi:uncharacterized protein YceK
MMTSEGCWRETIVKGKRHLSTVGCALMMVFIMSLSVGCSTVKVHLYDQQILHPYLGTKTAVKEFINSFTDYYIYGQQFLMAMDVPFCFAADTLLLPYDIIIKIRRHQQMPSG